MTRRRSSRPTLTITHMPGLRLERDVRAALVDLERVSGEDDQAIQMVNERLHGALAYTAAIGETCQVAAAADAVHDAERHLDARHPEHALTALEKALTFLNASRPGQR